MNELVKVTEGVPTTTTLAIAENTEVQHKNILELVRNYISELSQFGLVAFETRPRPEGQHGGGDVEFANLNERQATLIISFMKNTEIVRNFKVRLVKEFYEMAEKLNKPLTQIEMARQWALTSQELVKSLEREEQSQIELAAKQQKIDEDAPKVKLYDEVMDADTEHTFATVAGFIGCLEEELTMFCKHAMWLQSDVKGRVPTYKAKNEKWIIPTLGRESGMAVFTARGVEKVLNSVEKLKEGSPLMWSRIFGEAKQYGRKFKLEQKRRMDEFVAYVEERKLREKQ